MTRRIQNKKKWGGEGREGEKERNHDVEGGEGTGMQKCHTHTHTYHTREERGS